MIGCNNATVIKLAPMICTSKLLMGVHSTTKKNDADLKNSVQHMICQEQ